MKKSRLIHICTILLVLFSLAGTFSVVQAAAIPTFSITAVDADSTVTIYTDSFPAGVTFRVLMGEFGTDGVGSIEVDTIDSGEGGSFEITFLIPGELKGIKFIAIRLEGVDSNYYATNWFYNMTPIPAEDIYTGIPTFSILSVEEDSTVTIYTDNFPKGEYFYVLMGKYGTLGSGGFEADIIESGEGGSFSITFLIPEELKGENIIAMRIEGVESEYFATNWFYNRNTQPGEAASTGLPAFSILSVDEDSTVAIETENFPAEEMFTVRMGEFGTKGVDGVEIDTFESGEGGGFSITFLIPEELKGRERIDLCLEGEETALSVCNWFWNKTTMVE